MGVREPTVESEMRKCTEGKKCVGSIIEVYHTCVYMFLMVFTRKRVQSGRT